MTDPINETASLIPAPYEPRDWQCLLCRARVGNPPVAHDCRVEARIREIVREELDARAKYAVTELGIEGCPKSYRIAQYGELEPCILAGGHPGKCQLRSQSGVPYVVPGEKG